MDLNNTTHKKFAELESWRCAWVRITSPSPSALASKRNPQWREEAISLLVAVTILLALVEIGTSFDDRPRVIVLSLTICANVAALFLKRSGMTRLAGFFIVCSIELGLISAFLTAGGGHPDIKHIPLLDHLLQSVIIAMAVFTPMVGLSIAVLNCLFIFGLLKFYPFTGNLSHHLAESFWEIALPPLLLQIFIAVIFFIIIHILLKAIRRADNAEELARLRESELQLRAQEMERSRQLEVGTHFILQTLNTTVASGDFSRRVPLTQENLLWRIGYSINNLLARLQGFKQEQAEIARARAVVNLLKECMSRGQAFPTHQWTGTFVDPLIMEYNKRFKQLESPSAPGLKRERAFPNSEALSGVQELGTYR